MPRPGATTVPGLFAAGEVARRDARRESPGRQLAVRPARVRPANRRRRGRLRGVPRAAAVRRPDRRCGRPSRSWAHRSSRRRARTRIALQRRPPGRRCSRLVGHLPGRGRPARRRSTELADDSGDAGDAPAGARDGAPSTRAGTWCSSCATCSIVSEAITRSALQRTESRGAHSRLDYPDTTTPAGAGRTASISPRRQDG